MTGIDPWAVVFGLCVGGAFGGVMLWVFGYDAGKTAAHVECRDAIAEAQVARAEAETKLLVLQNELRKLIDGA